MSALSVCGFLSSEFTFYAFLPRSGSARTAKLAEITTAQREKYAILEVHLMELGSTFLWPGLHASCHTGDVNVPQRTKD